MMIIVKTIKIVFLYVYVYFFSKIRNFFLSIFGGCHFCVLVYHRVDDDYKDSVTVGINQFKEQIQIIKNSYEVISLEALLSSKNTKFKKVVVAITFDDGYADNYEAARFLTSQNIKSTFFISTRIVGTSNSFPHDIKRLGFRVPSLSWEQICEMSQWGHAFASHTANHPNLSLLSAEDAVKEISQGQQDLFDKLGGATSINLFAYPHGRKEDLPEGARKALSGLGIEYCFSAYGGVNHSTFDNYDIRRQGVDHAFSNLSFKAALEGWKVRIPKRR